MIDQLDRLLTWLFATRLAKWIAVHVLHLPPEKCNMCYTRVRWAQFLVWSTPWLDLLIHDKRLDWKVKANPLPDGWSLSSMQPVASSPSALWAGAGDSASPHDSFELSDQPLLESMLSVVELAVLYGDDPPRWPPWWSPTVRDAAQRRYDNHVLGSRRQYAEW